MHGTDQHTPVGYRSYPAEVCVRRVWGPLGVRECAVRLLLRIVRAARYRGAMAGWDDVTTYEQVQAMAPDERSAHFRASVVLDPSTLPAAQQRRLAEMTAEMNARAVVREERLRGQAS